jgi:hypothetical protein
LFKKSFVFIKLKCAPDIINYTPDETPEHILHWKEIKKPANHGYEPPKQAAGHYTLRFAG